VIYIVLRDVCANREQLIMTNLDGMNSTIDGENIVLSEAMLKVIRCSGEETLAGQMGIEKVFDTSDKVDEAFKIIYSAVDDLANSTSSVDSSTSEVDQAGRNLDRNASSTAYVPGELQRDINNTAWLCVQLPVDYASVPNVDPCPLGTACSQMGHCADCIIANSCSAGTKCETRSNCETKAASAATAAGRMDDALATLEAEKQAAVGSIFELLASLNATSGTVGGIKNRVGVLRDNMTVLVDFVKTTPSYSKVLYTVYSLYSYTHHTHYTPSYSKCAFVGDAYRTIVDQAMCKDIEQSFYQIYGSSALGVATMVVGFFLLLPWLQAPLPNEGGQNNGSLPTKRGGRQQTADMQSRYASAPVPLDVLGNQLDQYDPAIAAAQQQQMQRQQRRQVEQQWQEQQHQQQGVVRQQQIHQQMMALSQQQQAQRQPQFNVHH
jgi:hypothetical protein